MMHADWRRSQQQQPWRPSAWSSPPPSVARPRCAPLLFFFFITLEPRVESLLFFFFFIPLEPRVECLELSDTTIYEP